MFKITNNELVFEKDHTKISFTINTKEENLTSKIFILINCFDAGIDNTLDKIKKIDSVVQVQRIDGQYDIIVALEADTNDEIKKAAYQIRTIDTIKHTLILRSSLDMGVLG